jgi:DnaJ-class molecular chaperone
MGKGHWRRPCCTGREESDLRASLLAGDITKLRYNKEFRKLLLAGRIFRDGRAVRPQYDECPKCRGRGLVTDWDQTDRQDCGSRVACPKCNGSKEVLACPTA